MRERRVANAQDTRIDAILASLTGAGGPFSTQSVAVNGRTLPMIATAPPHLPAFFEAMCARHADACFIVDGDQRFSFAETFAAARALAGALVEGHAVQRGDRVALAARNSAFWVVAYMAILMAGGVATLINGFLQGEEMAAALADTGVSLVLADPLRAQRLAQAARLPGVRTILIDDASPLQDGLQHLLAAGGGSETPLPALTGDDLATILFTSGSTGKSKGAYSTHRQKVQGTFNYVTQTVTLLTFLTQENRAPKHGPSTLINVPLFHITGELTVFLQSFALGRKMVMMPKWDAREAMRLIEAERVTYFTGVPLMSFEILAHPEREQFDLSSCGAFAAGGAARPADHVRRFHDEMPGGEPLAGYGLTETNGVGASIYGEPYLAKPSSIGRAQAPLVELAIRDDAGSAVAPGEKGEICIRSIANFSGYWENRQATADAFTADGFFRTGDIGRIDDDAYLFIIDRKKDIIIRGGENITCPEVEAALYALPDIAEACVFGLPDTRFGEIPAAVVTLQPGRIMTAADITAALHKSLAAFKVPAKIWLEPGQLPRLGTGKIDKAMLRKAYQARYAAGG
jgi:acyl-CoA synthetase (AMP-forming)/AMP-acid ligase II